MIPSLAEATLCITRGDTGDQKPVTNDIGNTTIGYNIDITTIRYNTADQGDW